MAKHSLLNPSILQNLLWFLASLSVAFFVWVIATTQSDPIQERQFRQIPVQIEPDEGWMVVNKPTSTVRVNVRAQKSVLDLLTSDDIVVRADLHGLKAGTHVVELMPEIAPQRRASADTQPTQITVALEEVEARQVRVQAAVISDPPAGYERDNPVLDTSQALVSGAKSQVERVVAVQALLDLSQQRTIFQQDVRLTPIDIDRNPVSDVTVEPQTVRVTVSIRQREDVKQVSVTPNILVNTLAAGYVLTSISYSPETILVSGSQSDLALIPGTLFTAPVDLTNRRSDFEITVPVELPSSNLLVLSDQNITVSLGVSALTSTRQFDNLPVGIVGLSPGYSARVAPNQVQALVTGPQPILEGLISDNIDVVVDLSGLDAGSYTLVPIVTINEGRITLENISILPGDLDVEITAPATEVPATTPDS